MTDWFGNLAMYIVMITVFVGFANVVLRYVGRFIGVRLTSNLVIELQWYLYSLIFFFGFAYILKHGINVRVDFWYAEQSRKRKAWIDIIGHLVSLIPFALLALWVTYTPVLTSWGLRPNGEWGNWEMSPDPNGLPRAPIKSMIIFAFLTLLLQGISELIKLIAIVRDKEKELGTAVEELQAPIRIE
ncbi:MAG: TRAP transporter small permease subunit [Ardenticatenaceae bacterium]|nr:TRAP transporter small permease subunit [Ardenticatenaceae bacterium]